MHDGSCTCLCSRSCCLLARLAARLAACLAACQLSAYPACFADCLWASAACVCCEFVCLLVRLLVGLSELFDALLLSCLSIVGLLVVPVQRHAFPRSPCFLGQGMLCSSFQAPICSRAGGFGTATDGRRRRELSQADVQRSRQSTGRWLICCFLFFFAVWVLMPLEWLKSMFVGNDPSPPRRPARHESHP